MHAILRDYTLRSHAHRTYKGTVPYATVRNRNTIRNGTAQVIKRIGYKILQFVRRMQVSFRNLFC